jgi:hypothetical protein
LFFRQHTSADDGRDPATEEAGFSLASLTRVYVILHRNSLRIKIRRAERSSRQLGASLPAEYARIRARPTGSGQHSPIT